MPIMDGYTLCRAVQIGRHVKDIPFMSTPPKYERKDEDCPERRRESVCPQTSEPEAFMNILKE